MMRKEGRQEEKIGERKRKRKKKPFYLKVPTKSS